MAYAHHLPRYLRVVVTTACPLRCGYCHLEGDPATGTHPVRDDELATLIDVGVSQGIRKVKFLGGEPLLHAGLPQVVRRLRAHHPGLDLSIITAGVAPMARLDALFDAGLSRANLSIHGWSLSSFALRRGSAGGHNLRRQILDQLLRRGRPLKLNYVWASEADSADLNDLLTWAAGRPLVVNVLDDLTKDLGPDTIFRELVRLRGAPRVDLSPDADSLDTLHLRWSDGLVVELKHQQLGALAPWTTCTSCPVRSACKEGIHAVRLTHDGLLRTCMDRPDVQLPVLALLRRDGPTAAAQAWGEWVSALARPGRLPSRTETFPLEAS